MYILDSRQEVEMSLTPAESELIVIYIRGPILSEGKSSGYAEIPLIR